MKYILSNGNVVNETTYKLLPDNFKVGAKEFEKPTEPEVLKTRKAKQND
jgi:hypothetical protein